MTYLGYIKANVSPPVFFTSGVKFRLSRICCEEGRILGCKRAFARLHPKIRVSTTEIPKEPNGDDHSVIGHFLFRLQLDFQGCLFHNIYPCWVEPFYIDRGSSVQKQSLA